MITEDEDENEDEEGVEKRGFADDVTMLMRSMPPLDMRKCSMLSPVAYKFLRVATSSQYPSKLLKTSLGSELSAIVVFPSSPLPPPSPLVE